jgi:voltage-gated potassium channel
MIKQWLRSEDAPRILLLVFMLIIYIDLFLVSIGLFVIYPDGQQPNAVALVPPVVFLPIIVIILFRQLPLLKERSRRLYRAALLFPSLSLIAFLAYGDWIISKLEPGSFYALKTKWDAVYFTITTMSTVGYGDIHPQSQLAKFWVVSQIIIGFSFVAFVIQKEVMAGRPAKKK